MNPYDDFDEPGTYAATSNKGMKNAYDLESGLSPVHAQYVSQCENSVRAGFVRKVYGLLTMQLGVSLAAILYTISHDHVREFIHSHTILFQISLVLPLVIVCIPSRVMRQHPTNLVLLSFFTLAEAYLLAAVTSMYNPHIVLQAVGITACIVIGLTLYTMNSDADFSGMGPYLFGALLVLVVASFMRIFFPVSSAMDTAMAAFGALLFSLFIVYDTNQIMTKLGPDEYVHAALSLYLDIINLFLEILRLLSKNQN